MKEGRDYVIKRERKDVLFEDTNVIKVKTTYIIEFNNELIIENEYILETPYNYFRIPEDLSDRAIIFKLNNMDANIITEKIIWYYIFEEIYQDKSNEWINCRNKLKQDLFESNFEEQLNNFPECPEIDEEICNKIEHIEIKNFIQKEDKFIKLLEYPYKKNIVKYHHNSDIPDNKIIISYFFLSIFWIFLTLFFTPELLLFNILMVCLFLFFFLFTLSQKINAIRNNYKDKLMKSNDLKKKFDNSIKFFLVTDKKTKKKITNKRKKDISLFLDSHSEKLFELIEDTIRLDVHKAIQDYKTFNPIQFKIIFENEKVYPIPTAYKGFLHKTKIPIIIRKIHTGKKLFSIEVKTREIIQKKRKLNNIKQIEHQSEKKNSYISCFALIFIILVLIIIPPSYNALAVSLILIIIIIFLSFFPTSYIYHSPLQNYTKEDQSHKKLVANLLNSLHKIYTIPIKHRSDCSYYFIAQAPRFHKIKITQELKDLMLKKLNVKIPENLSDTIESFNIPRKLIMKGYDLEIDIEIPLNQRLLVWIIGIFIMFCIMIYSGISYLILLFFYPELLNNKIQDFTNIRIILTFLTLLIGFFGRDFLGNLTKDLKKIGIALISLSFIVGILYSIPIFLYL